MRIAVHLTGEGNFSFSQALALRSASLNPAAPFITSTSFDSEREVAEKYPEAASILAKLSSHRERIKVLHEIDATQLRRHFDEQSFDEVWFNFPHLGREDLRSHIALVAHFFHSAMQVLRPGGTICLALSEEQQRIWEMYGEAAPPMAEQVVPNSFVLPHLFALACDTDTSRRADSVWFA